MIKTGTRNVLGSSMKVVDLTCDCLSDCKTISFIKSDDNAEIDISITYEGQMALYDFSLWQRIKMCCRILFKRHIHYDNLCATKETIKELTKELNKLVK